MITRPAKNKNLDKETQKTYLKDAQLEPYHTNLVSKFFSPAIMTLAPGMKYQKNKHWFAFLSPAALELTYIGDQDIANLGVHGTQLKKGSTTEYLQSKIGLGALGKIGYTNMFLKKLLSNYFQ